MRAFYYFLLCKPYLPPEIRHMICQAFIRSNVFDKMGLLSLPQLQWLDLFFTKKYEIIETKKGFGKSEFIAKLATALLLVRTSISILITCTCKRECQRMMYRIFDMLDWRGVLTYRNMEKIATDHSSIKVVPSTAMVGRFDLYLYDGVIPKQHRNNEFIIV